MRITLVTSNHPKQKMGGAEYQTWLLAKGLKEHGHSVTLLATNTEENCEYVDDAGVAVIEIPNRRIAGETRHKELAKQAVERWQPDIVYIRRFEDISRLADVCRANGIPFVSMSVHAMETSPFFLGYHPSQTIRNVRSKRALLYLQSFYAIRDSAVHVCNLRGLQTKIEKWYPRKRIETIYNGSPIPDINDEPKKPSRQVIWVNNMKRWKRPEIYIDLARHLPDYRFVMVGRLPSGRYGKEIERMLAEATPNLDYVGPKPIDEANELIRNSDLLLYTSMPVEGFANSFLQAWLREVPTISYTFDLDGIIEQENIGRCASDFDELVDAVDELMRDDAGRQQMGKHAREYAVNQFSVDKMVLEYETLFNEILDSAK